MEFVNSLVEPLGWTLLHFVWQGLAIGLLHEIALLALAGRRPQLRYAVSLVALLVALLAPIITFLLLAFEPPGSANPPLAASAGITLQAAFVATAAGSPSISSLVGKALPYIVTAWMFGVLALTVRFGAGLWSLRRLAANADFEAVSDWMHHELARLVERMGIRKPVRIALSTRVGSPLVVGWLKPVIFLPLSAATGLDHNQIRMVLAHELAHLRRHDHLVNFLQVLVETVLFYHPAVHRISRSLRQEREQCCDDMAAAISGNAVAYARVLADLEALRQKERRHVLALGIAEQELYFRIQRLVGAPARSGPDRWLPLMLIGLAASVAIGQSPTLDAPLFPEMFNKSTARQRIALELPRPSTRPFRPIEAKADGTVIETRVQAARESAASMAAQASRIDPPVAQKLAPGSNVSTARARDVAEETAAAPAPMATTTPETIAGTDTTQPEQQAPVISGGELLHAEEPEYPRRALRYGEEGQVLMEFTITAEGRVIDAEVLEASPRGIFDASALAAIRQWRYQPFMEDGVPIARRATQLLEFRLGEEPVRRAGTPAAGECREQTGTRLCRAPHSDNTQLKVLRN